MWSYLIYGVTTTEVGIKLPGKIHYARQYNSPAFIGAFTEVDALLSEQYQYNGHPQVESVDTHMYGFWGGEYKWLNA